MSYADLELSLRRWSGDDYAVEFRFQLADSSAEAHLISGQPPRVRIDFDELDELRLEPRAYGEALTRMLLSDARIPDALARARREAEAADIPLRLRLRLAADDEQIHAPLWETLNDPARGGFLCASERVLLSRYLDSADMTPLAARPRADLRAVVIVANPTGLEGYKLAPVDVAGEVARSSAALAGIATTLIAREINGQAASVANLAAALRDGPDILYLVAHGTLRRGRPFIWLEDEAGGIDRIEGEELVEAIERLARRPLLVVLASCQSAGAGQDQGALAALGPRLASAGIAATIAMQGNVTMATVERAMPIFFRELQRDGQIDRALAAARAAVLDRPDWWMPVLFLRVRDGQLWSAPEPAKAAADIPPPPTPERPPEVPGFVGREAELAMLEATLARDHLAIITGMPGVGKTSLATLLARKVTATDRIFWHSFKAGEGVDALIWALAGFLAHNEQTGMWQLLQSARQSGSQPPPINVLFDYLLQMLAGQSYLLCLDDIGFVVDDPQIERFVERLRSELRIGGLDLILTSRRLPAFVADAEVKALAGLSMDDAQRLLDARGVALPDALLADLHAQTGGNVQFLSLAINALRRTHDPARLIGDLAAADDIERYLLNEVDKGLSDDERQVMRAIAVLLDDGGTRDAIEALLEGTNARRTLRALGDRYLLITADGPEGRVYKLHRIVQPFYYGELNKRERVQLHQQAGAYYENEERDLLRAAIHFDRAGDYAHAADLATADVLAIVNASQARALRQQLERFLVRQNEPDTTRHLGSERWASVLVALGSIYFHTGEPQLARHTSEEAFRYLAGQPESDVVRKLRVIACLDIGGYLEHETPHVALEWFRRGLAILGDDDRSEQAGDVHSRVANILSSLGDYQAALRTIQHALELLPSGASYWRVGALINQGRITYHLGDLDAAIAHTLHALVLSQQLHNSYRTITILGNLGAFKDVAGDWAGAIDYYRQAAELADRLGSHAQRVRVEQNLGQLLINRGDDQAALDHLTNSLNLARTHQLHEYTVASLLGISDLHIRRGETQEAVPLLADAEHLAADTDHKYRLTEIYRFRGIVRLEAQMLKEASADIERAITLAREIGDSYDEGLSLRVQGQVLRAASQPESALAAFERSQELLADDPYESARTQMQRGLALRDGGDTENGAAMLCEARATFARLGAKRDLAEVDTALKVYLRNFA